MTDSQKWLVFIFLAAMAWLTYLLSSVLMPFVISAMFAYLGDPLTDKLETWRLSRNQAVTLVFVVIFLLVFSFLLLVIPGLETQIGRLISNLPSYVEWLNSRVIPGLEKFLDIKIGTIDMSKMTGILKSHWQKAGGIAASVMASVSHSGGVIFDWAMNLILIPVVTFYLLRDWDILLAKILDLLPRRATPLVQKLAQEVDSVLSAFFRGQLLVMLALGAIYTVGLWLTGLDLALVIGMASGIVSFVPYLGAFVGIFLASLAAFLQFHDVIYLVPVAVVFGVGQSLEGMVLTPLLVGDKIGLHPVAVIFAVLAGGQLFGFLGILLALPVASIIMVFLRHIHDIYRDSDFYSQAGKS